VLSHASRLLIAVSVLALGPPSPAISQRLVIPLAELCDDDLAAIDLHDGHVDDWLEVIGGPTLTTRDACRTYGLSYWMAYDPTDLDFRIWLAWHDATNRIYVAFERLDDRYENDFTRTDPHGVARYMGYHDSSLELWVDGDLQSRALTTYEWAKLPMLEKARATVRAQQAYTGLAEVFDGGPHLALRWSYTDWMLRPPYSEASGRRSGDNPIVTVLEFCFTPFDMLLLDDPEGSQPTDLFPGKTIGLQIYVNDRDDGKLEYYSFGPPVTKFDLGPMAHGYLVGRFQAGSGLDGLAESSWAAVKHTAAHDSTAAGPTED